MPQIGALQHCLITVLECFIDWLIVRSDAEVGETRCRRHRAGEESSDSDASEEPHDELASSHSSDKDERGGQDARGPSCRTSARPTESRAYLLSFFSSCRHGTGIKEPV